MTYDEIRANVRVTTSMLARDGMAYGEGTILADHRFPNLDDRFTVKFDRFPYPMDIALESAYKFTTL